MGLARDLGGMEKQLRQSRSSEINGESSEVERSAAIRSGEHRHIRLQRELACAFAKYDTGRRQPDLVVIASTPSMSRPSVVS
jgi:hypothetical protein